MRSTITVLLIVLFAGSGVAAAMEQPRHLNAAIRVQMRKANSQPGNPGVLNDLGNLLTLAGALEEAEEVYRRALALSPEDAITHYNLALLLRLDARKRAALRELQTAVKLDPDDAWGHYQLGVLLEERNKPKKATHHFAQSFLLDPSMAQFESNPQLLDSRLTTRAMMVAYEERVARFEMAPRQYAQPKKVTGLLVPEAGMPAEHAAEAGAELSDAEADAEEAPPKRKRDGRKRAKRQNDGGS